VTAGGPGRLALVLLLIAVLASCGSPVPYETEAGEATRLDGTKAHVNALTIADALERPPRSLTFVRGYLIVPVDDVNRLCTRLSGDGRCERPSLVLQNAHEDLRRIAARVLEHGCCAIASWTPRPVVLEVRLDGPRDVVVLG
jgi:hypothetical protein